jgi:hypothetical protein
LSRWTPRPADGYVNGRELKRRQRYSYGDVVYIQRRIGSQRIVAFVITSRFHASGKYRYFAKGPDVGKYDTFYHSDIHGICDDVGEIVKLKLMGYL